MWCPLATGAVHPQEGESERGTWSGVLNSGLGWKSKPKEDDIIKSALTTSLTYQPIINHME